MDVLVHPRQAVLLRGPQQTSLESSQHVYVQGDMKSEDNPSKYTRGRSGKGIQGLSQHSSVKRSQPKLTMVGLTHPLEWQKCGNMYEVNWMPVIIRTALGAMH